MSDERDHDSELNAPHGSELGERAGEAVFDDEGEGAAAMARLFAADGPPDLDDGLLDGPLYWPEIPATDIEQEFRDLRAWVQELIERFEHLDHKAIPVCWWRHNGHVEALQALRDHERMSYAESSPAQAATAWHREFQFIESRLREWTTYYGCDQEHKEGTRRPRLVDEQAWNDHMRNERQRREHRELGGA